MEVPGISQLLLRSLTKIRTNSVVRIQPSHSSQKDRQGWYFLCCMSIHCPKTIIICHDWSRWDGIRVYLCMVYICADIHVNKSRSYSVASTPDLTGLVFMRKFMGGSVLGTCFWGSQTDLSMWICPLAFLQAEQHPPRPLPHPPHEERLPPPLEAIYTTRTSFSANHDF